MGRAPVYAFLVVAVLHAVWFTDARFAPESVRATLPAHLTPQPGKPSRYRVLPVLAARALAAATGLPPLERAPEEPLRRVEMLAMLALSLAFWWYLARILGSEERAALAAPFLFGVLAFHYLVPHRGLYYTPFDVPGVLFFTLGAALLHARKWTAYAVVLVLGTLNRETTAFLPVLYLVTAAGTVPWRTLAAAAGAQLAAWLAVKAALRVALGPGLFQAQLDNNLQVLADPTHWPLLASVAGFLWLPAALAAPRVADLFVRRSVLVAPPFVCGMLLVGHVLELRLFAELAPLLLAVLVAALAGTGSAPREAQERLAGDR